MLQPVQYAIPGHVPVRAPVAAETVTAVQGASEGDRARNDLISDNGTEAEARAQEARNRAPDPSEPVGPPPAFQANVLEAERARLKEVEPPKAKSDATPGAAPETAARIPPAAEPAARVKRAAEHREAVDERREARADRAEARESRAEAREAPQPTRSAYGSVKEDPPRMLDVSR